MLFDQVGCLMNLLLLLTTFACAQDDLRQVVAGPNIAVNGIPFSTRAFWIRQANAALAELESPCPVGAFATAIVNHTVPGLGELVCLGVNRARSTGNPTLHGEMVAIANCTAIMTDPSGPYRLTPSETEAAFSQLSLYTNAESCSMCASAIRFTGFREYIFGSSIQSLVERGWQQIRIPSIEVVRQSFDLSTQTRLIGGVLANETDPLFSWQFDPLFPCPRGCARANVTSACEPV